VHGLFGEKLMQDKPVLLRLHIGSPYHKKDKFIKHTIEEIEKHLVQIQRIYRFCSMCQFKNWQQDQFIGESRNTWRKSNQETFYIALLYRMNPKNG
jgi:hypothetical protein